MPFRTKRMIPLTLILLLQRVSAKQVPVGQVATVAGGGEVHDGSKADCNDQPIMDGFRDNARFNYPWGIVYDPTENALYVADCGCHFTNHTNDRIRKLAIESGEVTTIAGSAKGYRDGVGTDAMLHHSAGMALDVEARRLYVADSGNDRIRVLDLKTYMVSTYIGDGKPALKDGIGTSASLWNPQSLAISPESTRLFVADTDNHAIRVVHLSSATIRTLAGGTKGLKDGIGRDARFFHPTGMCFDPDTNALYIADHYNHVIRKLNLLNNRVSTLCGNGRRGLKDGVGYEAQFYYPEGMTYDRDHQVIYVVEFDNNAVRMISPEHGKVTTFAGGVRGYKDGVGRKAKFYHPTGLTYDHDNKLIYITDQFNHRIRSITAVGFLSKKGYWLFGYTDTTILYFLIITGIVFFFVTFRYHRLLVRIFFKSDAARTV